MLRWSKSSGTRLTGRSSNGRKARSAAVPDGTSSPNWICCGNLEGAADRLFEPPNTLELPGSRVRMSSFWGTEPLQRMTGGDVTDLAAVRSSY